MTVSEGHQWPPPPGAPVTDRGGSFYTTKSYVEGNPKMQVSAKHYEYGSTFKLDGPVIAAYPLANGKLAFPSPSSSSNAQLDQLGATAIARCEPTNSIADVSTFLGELYKDGLPSLPGIHLWESKVRAAKAAGDEFLNAVFGWAPLVNDVTKISNAAKHAHAVLAQYERDSGRMVRRRYNFPSSHDVKDDYIVSTNAWPQYAGGATGAVNTPSSPGILVRKEESFRRQWFSGAFTYYLPSDYDSRRGMVDAAYQADKLLGTSLTPETVWELAPWSWAIDWFTNTGDVLHNISAFAKNGLVMRYGYMMEHTIVKHSYILRRAKLDNYPASPQLVEPPPLVLVTETKVRRPANPFGFGVSWDSLSSFQASVLAALGISRRG